MMAATSSLVLSEDDVLDCSVSRGEDAEEEVDHRAAIFHVSGSSRESRALSHTMSVPQCTNSRILPCLPA